jgi:hypothetical protein
VTCSHLGEVTVPSGTSQGTGVVEAEWFTGKASERKVDCLAFRREVVSLHDITASVVINIDVRASHTPSMHQLVERLDAAIGRTSSALPVAEWLSVCWSVPWPS